MFPCVCCGYVTLDEAPGSYQICPICYWEDDAVQLRYPSLPVGANHVSLRQAQANFAETGASEPRLHPGVRAARAEDERDEGWRPIVPTMDRFEPFPSRPDLSPGMTYFYAASEEPMVGAVPAPSDPTVLYWWRPTFWNPMAGR